MLLSFREFTENKIKSKRHIHSSYYWCLTMSYCFKAKISSVFRNNVKFVQFCMLVLGGGDIGEIFDLVPSLKSTFFIINYLL